MVVLSLHTGTSDHGNGRIDSDVTRGLWVAQVRRLVSDGCGDMAANLYGAARSGDVVEVREVVAAGSDVEERGEDGGTPLHVATEEVMRVLLEMDAEKEAKDDIMDRRRFTRRHATGTWRRSRRWRRWARPSVLRRLVESPPSRSATNAVIIRWRRC